MPDLRHIPGVVSATLSQRRVDDAIEFLVLTTWQSLVTVRAFAAEDVGAAVVDSSVREMLLDSETRVRHYDVIEVG